ncbi:MAG: hypothetical protein AB1487_02225 [Thermodesulfobacteriota bacterium]
MEFADKINTILCDDVREEVGNKTSLMGIYPESMVFEKLPAILPKLCLFVMLIKTKKRIPKFEVTLTTPRAEPIRNALPEPPNQQIGGNLNLAIVISPFRINSPGEAKFEIYFEEETKPLVHKFGIHLAKKPRRAPTKK